MVKKTQFIHNSIKGIVENKSCTMQGSDGTNLIFEQFPTYSDAGLSDNSSLKTQETKTCIV